MNVLNHTGYVTWINEERETGWPYDLMVYLPGDDTHPSRKIFFEVKTTCTHSKSFFEMSPREWMFAYEHRDNYVVLRVFDAFTDHPRVVRLTNPWELWRSGSLGMWVAL